MTRDDKENIAAILGILLATVSLGIFLVFVVGLAVTKFWNLFAPEMFGAPVADWKHGIGLVGFVVCLRGCLGDLVSVKARR